MFPAPRLLAALPHSVAEAVGGVMVATGVLLAYLQEGTVATEQQAVSVATAIIQALTVGGGLAAGGTFLLRRVDKILDARESFRREETAAERAERDRMFAQREAEIARLVALNELLLSKLFEQREANRHAS